LPSSRGTVRRGAQLPRIRLEPKYTYTDGLDAADLAESYGMRPDPWQKMLLECWMGRDSDDRFTCTTCGLAVPRQNGKNAVLEMRELYGITVNGESILHTAHEVRTARKAFNRLASFFSDSVRYPELADMVVSIRKTNGQEAIILNNGGQIEFSARSKVAARGFTVDVMVLDEAQELTDEQLEALMYAISASPNDNRQMIYTGTPPGPTSPGEVFPRIRKSVIDGEADDRTSWHEWSVENLPSQSEDRMELAYQTNPAMGIRLTEEFTMTEMSTSSADGFARERLGWWSGKASQSVFSPSKWDACRIDDTPSHGKIAYGVKFSPDGASVALSIAIKPQEGKPHVELVNHCSMRDGIGWIVQWLDDRLGSYACVVIDGKSYAGSLIEELNMMGGFPSKIIVSPRVKDITTSAQMILNAVNDSSITHFGQPELDDSAKGCIKRKVGQDGSWGLGSSDSADSTPIESCSLSYWGVMTTKRDPNRKVRLL
jgi:hypothetical protein